MTTMEIWIDAQFSTLKENLVILEEIKEDMGKLVIQLSVMKHHLGSMIDFLETQSKFK